MKVCVFCKTRYKMGNGITFLKFPSDYSKKLLWLKNMNLKNWESKSKNYLCSKHFTEGCFIKHVTRTTLRSDSVPTIFIENTASAGGDTVTTTSTPCMSGITVGVKRKLFNGSGLYIPRYDSRQAFLRSLGTLKNLRVLALEYSHIADGTGAALISLLPIMKRPLFRLQLMCREDQIPGYTDASLGSGGYDIPDTAWRRVTIACPDLYVFMAFYCIRDYDNIRRFLVPSIPLRETHLQYGIDVKMRQRQDSDFSCFVRHIAFRYASTLETLSIHQWRFVFFPLQSIFELMPFLVKFIYVGRVESADELHRLLRVLACGVHNKLKYTRIQIQDEESKKDYWREIIATLIEEYRDIMELYDIKFCLCIYKN